MARTLKVFSADETIAIIDLIRGRVADFDFQKNYLIPSDLNDSRRPGVRLAEVANAAAESFGSILIAPVKLRPGLLTEWMTTYIAPPGRVRILDSLRQKKAARARTMGKNDGQTQALMTPFASSTFADLAAEAGLTKKDFFAELATWLYYTQDGRKVVETFTRAVQKQKANSGV